MSDATPGWPAAPFKGLNYYGPEDRPLLTGRDDDVVRIAHALGAEDTRLLLLHGSTGAGKSSLLRAGLIPFLQGEAGGFQFLHEDKAERAEALFIRCTDVPLAKMAECVHALASRGLPLRSRRGTSTLDLSAALLAHESMESFREDVGASGARMLEALGALSRRLPRTLVLVVDQGEEILTIRPGPDGASSRDQFFGFLAAFSQAGLDVKLLVALRTEFYGRFRYELDRRGADALKIRDCYLPTLTGPALVEAIERPTLRTPVGEFGIPWEAYRFAFAPGLPERIAGELEGNTPTGGILPVMQVVCGRLYEAARKKARIGEWKISEADYEALGGVHGQLDAYMNEALDAACRSLKVKEAALTRERSRWKAVLSKLVKSQADGTVTTELVLEDDLKKEAKAHGCKLPFAEMMDKLCAEDQRICRRIEVTRREMGSGTRAAREEEPSDPGEKKAVCYCLGHDAIGLALHRWKVLRWALVQRLQSQQRTGLVMGVVSVAIGVALVWVAFATDKIETTPAILAGALLVYGLGMIVWGRMGARAYDFMLQPWALRLFGKVTRMSPEAIARLEDEAKHLPAE